MPIELLDKSIDVHPITDLDYELITEIVDVGGQSLRLTTLANVEQSIDLVFHWLESKGRDSAEIEQLAPYFGVVWPSSLALCGYLLQDKIYSRLKGKSVIELGCGLAIPSIIASKGGAICTATDNHPNVLQFLVRNVELNEPSSIRYVTLSGSEGSKFSHSSANEFDLVIASDVLYEQKLVEHFAEEVSKYSKAGTTCIIADPGRPYIQDFVTSMNSRGWRDQLQPWTVPYKGGPRDIFVLIFNRD